MIKTCSSAFAAVLLALPVAAQSTSKPLSSAAALPSATASAHELWMTAASFILTAAEQVPEARYSFRPTPNVRSLGEVFVHVASAHYLLCGTVLGEKERDIGKPTSKADVLSVLKESMNYCDIAYGISDADAMKPATVFDLPRTNLHALMMNAWHDNEHYGNIATYMRLEGMVPPSSQPEEITRVRWRVRRRSAAVDGRSSVSARGHVTADQCDAGLTGLNISRKA